MMTMNSCVFYTNFQTCLGPKVSSKQKVLLSELGYVFDMPPNKSTLKVFRRGGSGYFEGLGDTLGSPESWEFLEVLAMKEIK